MRIVTCPRCGRRVKRFTKYDPPAKVPDHSEVRHDGTNWDNWCRGSSRVCVEDEVKGESNANHLPAMHPGR